MTVFVGKWLIFHCPRAQVSLAQCLGPILVSHCPLDIVWGPNTNGESPGDLKLLLLPDMIHSMLSGCSLPKGSPISAYLLK